MHPTPNFYINANPWISGVSGVGLCLIAKEKGVTITLYINISLAKQMMGLEQKMSSYWGDYI